MAISDLYADDLINRNPGFTFLETPVGSMTLVEFRDGGLAVVASSQKLDVNDAYRNIRGDILGDLSILPIISESQRDALSGIENGQMIYNTDGAGEILIAGTWDPF